MARMAELALQHANLKAALQMAKDDYDRLYATDASPYEEQEALAKYWNAEEDLEAFEREHANIITAAG